MSKQENSKIGWSILLIVSLSALIITIDTTFLSVAIKNLVVDLNTTVSIIQLIIATYSLTVASLMLIGSKLQDIVGRKKIFIIGAVIFGAGNLVASLSVNATMLLLGWSILEGVGAALMTPATVSIISGTYKGRQRVFALGVWTSFTSIGATIGPLFGGFITTFFSWRYGFALESVVILFILLLSPKIRSFPPQMHLSDLDKTGSILSIMGLFIFVLGIISLNLIKNNILSILIIVSGLIILFIFFRYENRRISQNYKPLIDILLFRDRNFTLGNISRLIVYLGLAGSIFVLPVFIQVVKGADAFSTGLVLFPLELGLFIFSIISTRLSARIQPRYLISLGFIMSIIGCLILRNQFDMTTGIWQLAPGTFVLGMGFGLSLPLTASVILSKQEKESDASGIMSTFANLGFSVGTALIGIILLIGIFAGLSSAVAETFPNKFSSDEIQKNIVGWVDKMKTTDIPHLEEDKKPTLYKLTDITIRETMKDTFYYIVFIFLIGFVTSLFIKPVDKGR